MLRRKKRIRRNTYKGRFKNRRSMLLSRARRTGLFVLVAVAFGLFNLMLILGHDWITQTRRLGIHAISVSGCERLTPEMVKRQAGLQDARNILAVNLSIARKRLLANPWIAEARVSRDIPDRLQIHIREHKCLAILDLGRRFLLSEEGRVFKELAPGENPEVPVVSGLTYTDLGQREATPTRVMRSVMQLLQPRQRSDHQAWKTRIREIHADPLLGLTVFLKNGPSPEGYRTVMLGFESFDEKYATMERIDAFLHKNGRFEGFKLIDLNNLNRIIVHPMETGAAEDARKEV